MKITLVRHGQTEENFCNRVQGKKNNLLNDSLFIKSFISIIVKNTAIDIYRKNLSNKVEIELDDNFIFPSDELEEVEIEGLNNIEIAIMKLTEIYKEVFLLKYSHELENNEIAKLLNIKESTVRVRLARGKEKLEFILNKMEGVDNE